VNVNKLLFTKQTAFPLEFESVVAIMFPSSFTSTLTEPSP